MSKRFPRARYALPEQIDPPDHICFQVEVPNDRLHIAAFLGQIYSLSRPYSWGNDDTHLAIQVGAVWVKIFDNLVRGCPCPSPAGTAGADGGDDFMLRQNPANPCELQSSVDGVTWCTWADLSKCLPASPQPGGGTGQPPPGGCSTIQGQMSSGDQYLVPFPVSTGDTLNLTLVTGAANDGTNNTWYCPDGTVFFAGACLTGTGGPKVGDPLPAAKHMRLIWKIGANYYDAMAGIFTVPAGVSLVQPVLQVNSAPLSANFGSYQFTVQVCNNAAAGWSHTIDFRTTNGGFSEVVPDNCDSGGLGVWQASTGWIQTNCEASGAQNQGCDIHRLFTGAATIDTVDFEYVANAASPTPCTTPGVTSEYEAPAGTLHIIQQNLVLTGAVQHSGGTGPWTANGLRLRAIVGCVADPAIPNGNFTLTKLTVTGSGFDPFV